MCSRSCQSSDYSSESRVLLALVRSPMFGLSRAAAKRTTGLPQPDDRTAHVAHFTAAVYSGTMSTTPDPPDRILSIFRNHLISTAAGSTALTASA